MYYVYFLASPKTKWIYIGVTNDLKRRIKEHKSGNSRYTKKANDWKLVYYEAYLDKKDAVIRERKLKKYGNSLGILKKRIINSLRI